MGHGEFYFFFTTARRQNFPKWMSGEEPDSAKAMSGEEINRPFLLFWPVLFLIIPDNCQWVMCNKFKIKTLEIKKNEIIGRTGQNAVNAVFANLLGQFVRKGRFEVGGETTPAFGHPSLRKKEGNS